MANNTNISYPVKGMNMDSHPINLNENSYDFALNAVVEDFTGNGFPLLQNESSFLPCVNFPIGYKLIGGLNVIEQDRKILFLVNPETGFSQIGEVIGKKDCDDKLSDSDDELGKCETCGENFIYEKQTQIKNINGCCEYIPIAVASCLNFNINNPVRATYRIEECGISVYFTDKLNPYRYIQFDYENDDVTKKLVIKDKFKTITGTDPENCNTPIYGGLDCNRILLDPVIEYPCIEFVDLLQGGDLKAGVYQFFFAFSDETGEKRTSFYAATNPIPIATRFETFDTDYKTNRSIQLKIENLTFKNPFDYYIIAVAKTINNVTSFEQVGFYPISQKTVVYSGNEKSLKDLTVNDVFEQKVFYKDAKHVANSNNYLFWAGLNETKKLNVQRIANKVKLKWQTVAIPEKAYSKAKYTNKFKGYMRDEVYAFGLVLIYDTGEESVVGHIPGPSKEYFQENYNLNVDEFISNEDVIEFDNCTNTVPDTIDCCPDPIPATISFNCSDGSCTHQGDTSLNITFATPTTESIDLLFGTVWDNGLIPGSQLTAQGYDIYGGLPVGMTSNSYYGANAHKPFKVTIPSGTTNISIPSQIFLQGEGPIVGSNTWICHTCQFPMTDVYIKPVLTSGSKINFTTDHPTIQVHSITPDNFVQDCVECDDLGSGSDRRWKMYNTAQLEYVDTNVPIEDDCDDNKCYQYGDFAYWESIERYPNNPEVWGELCGLPIRHHKFPDSIVTHIHDGLNGSKAYKDDNIIFPIGVKIDHDNVKQAILQALTDNIITEEDYQRIVGYRIVRGNRFGHKSIVAKGLIYDVWNYEKNGVTYYYPNYPYNDLRNDDFLSNSNSGYAGSFNNDQASGPALVFEKTKRYTFHSPDTHFVQPELGQEIKIETEEYGKCETYFNHAEEQAKQKMLSAMSYTIAFSYGALQMLLEHQEKKESTYTIRGVDLSAMGVSAGTYGPTTVPPIGVPFIAPANIYNNATGIGIPAVPPVSTVSGKTYQGTKEQYLNNPLLGALEGDPLGTILSPFLVVQSLFYKFGFILNQTQVFIDLLKTLIPYKNYGIQSNSVGKYNNYKIVNNAGFKRRKIETYSYLKPEMSLISEPITSFTSGSTNIFFNNWNRETSVYLKTDSIKSAFNNPLIVDNSRFALQSSNDFSTFDKVKFYKDISSFYASIKKSIPDQYGTILNIEYIDTGHCIYLKDDNLEDCSTVIFGGDTYINRFALKRKHSFFLQTRFNQLDGIDVDYTLLGNAAYPRYFYKTVTGIADSIETNSISDIITNPWQLLGRPTSFLECKTSKFFYQNGKIYLYNYGIPYFLVESDVNVDYRHAENNKEKNFYPNITDLDFWLQEKNVSPLEDNYYSYNTTYSKQNKEHVYSQYPFNFQPGRDCRVSHPNRVIHSNGAKWLNYKANDFYDFPLSNGSLTGINGIENDKVLVRSENTTQVFNAYVTIPTNADSIQVSNGGMFKSKPQEYAHTNLGYAGSQHACILNTEYGHIWVDAKRGQVFNLNSQGLDEISKNGLKNFFKENLPFQILKDFPSLSVTDLDNSFKGIGIILAFDKRFNRFLLTKRDYKVLNSDIIYDSDVKEFKLDNEVVFVDNKKYFCDKSWTVSYNFYTQSWTSFHSYTPNYYIESIDYLSSVINTDSASLWLHNSTNKSYQIFYGKTEPFIVQTVNKADITKSHVNSIEFGLDAIRYHKDYDPFFTNKITFNKAVVFTQNQNSGMLELDYNDKHDLNKLLNYPIANTNSTTIRVTNADGIWRFNQFYDLVQSRGNNIPIWKNNCANTEKHLNLLAFDYQMSDLNKKRIRGEFVKVRLINDEHTNYKLIFKWLINNSVKTFR